MEITLPSSSTYGILTMVSVLAIIGCILLGYKVRKLCTSFMLLQTLQQALQQTLQVRAKISIDIHVCKAVIRAASLKKTMQELLHKTKWLFL